MNLAFYVPFALMAGEYMYLGLLGALSGLLKSRGVASVLARIPSAVIVSYLYELNPTNGFRLSISWVAVIFLTSIIKSWIDDLEK